jgi:hypothetical protein
MLKQLKKNLKKKNYKNKNFNKNNSNFLKNYILKKQLSKLKLYGRPFVNKFISLKKYSFLTFHVYPNNVFCTLKKIKDSKFHLLSSVSSGKYKINISKKTLRYKLKFVIASFFNELSQQKLSLNKSLGIKLIAPVKLKKMILKLLVHKLKRKNFIIEVVGKKVFNGCRARKKLRKKRKGLRLYK